MIQPDKTTINKLMGDLAASELTKLWNEAVAAENKNLATTGGRIAQAEQKQKALPANLTPNPGYVSTPLSSGIYNFPLPTLPSQSYKEGGRRFGANRNKGERKHAGCDLIAAPGTPICAIADGKIRMNPYYFYNGTYALEVEHGPMLVRYGEILPCAIHDSRLAFLAEIKKGALVKKGQVIAYVGKMLKDSMLHFECYSNAALPGGLTDRSKSGGAFQRRSDLMDPTNLLDGAKGNLPQHPGNLDEKLVRAAITIGHSNIK